MRDFRRPGLWLGGWLLALVAVALGSLMPAAQIPEPGIGGFDKLLHFSGYAVLSGYAVMLFARRRTQAVAVLGVIAFGIALEAAQGLLTADRSADGADAIANALGALLGVVLARVASGRLLERLDRRLFSPRA